MYLSLEGTGVNNVKPPISIPRKELENYVERTRESGAGGR